MNGQKFLFGLLIIFAPIITFGAGKPYEIEYSDPGVIQKSGFNILILEDSTSKLNFEDIRNSNNFKLSPLEVPNLGVSKSTFWVKFTIRNKTELDRLLLQVSYPLLDVADLYSINPDGSYSIIKAGDSRVFSERKYKNQNFIFDISIPQNEARQYFLKVKGSEQILIPIIVSSPEPLFEVNSITDMIVGIYIGIILVMFFYNAFIYFTVRDKNYLFYIIYILFIGLTQISLLGYSFKYIWPENLWLSSHGLYIVASLGSAAIVIFMEHFLNMKLYAPKLIIGVYIIVFIYAMAITAALLDYPHISYNIIDINGMILSFYCLFVAIKISLKGYRPARFFLLGWSVFLVGVFVFVLRSFGTLPYNNLTNYTMPIGSALEVMLLSFALADRIKILQRERAESQSKALEALKENERIIKEQNIILETKVNERTSELKKSNGELNLTLNELKQTQSQLVNAEKMASLGQLTAGVAHEINNPINFVVSNVKPLRRDIMDIHELITKFEEIKDSTSLDEKIKTIDKFKKEIDYTYLKEEIEILLKGIEEGASRTAEIVKGLKTFSRLDESDLKNANIHEGIDSTLILLSQELSGISVEKKYDNLPLIECYPGKLNQVFMNIFNNAIYAINANKERKEKGKLTISTSIEGEEVKISIKDNGTGMDEATKAKIFEPFFTTKDVGRGTGLGMSITYSIIENHRGRLDVFTELNKGTELVIVLPLKQL